jgi:hypothetical protein
MAIAPDRRRKACRIVARFCPRSGLCGLTNAPDVTRFGRHGAAAERHDAQGWTPGRPQSVAEVVVPKPARALVVEVVAHVRSDLASAISHESGGALNPQQTPRAAGLVTTHSGYSLAL